MSNMLGVMFDCSRNGVLTIDTLKQYGAILKKMGYNTMLLYTEDTYEVDGEPYFGHLRGRYSKKELREIDRYCNEIGLELVPCIQVLAHLECMFKWDKVYGDVNDCHAIMLIGEEKTYALIDKMFSTFAECFTSKKIHVGMDEAYGVGTGKYQDRNGIQDKFEILNYHLHRVCEIARKYDFEPIIWGDMFYNYAFGLNHHYDEAKPENFKTPSDLPDNVSLVQWGYSTTDYDKSYRFLSNMKLLGRKVYFAGGAWEWRSLAPYNRYSIDCSRIALDACRDAGVEDVFITVWGDDGNECLKASVFPALLRIADMYNGIADAEITKRRFKEITGCNFDDFMLLDEFNNLGLDRSGVDAISKNIFYSDVLMGISDYVCDESFATHYRILADKIGAVSERGDFAHLFEYYEKLARFLELKSVIGIRCRKAYLENDKNGIESAIADLYELDKRFDEFSIDYREAWHKENKPYGFDVLDIRFGGLKYRMQSCRKKLEDYLSGKRIRIEELEEPVLELDNGFWWHWIISANRTR